MVGLYPPFFPWGLATTNPSKKTATGDIYIRRRLCGSQLEACSRNWWRATLTLQVSRRALLSGACLSAPRDCNFICRVILHRPDPRFCGKRRPQQARETPNGSSERRQSPSRVFPRVKTEAKAKHETVAWLLKGKSGLCLSIRGLMAVQTIILTRYGQETYSSLHKRRLSAVLCIIETINPSLLDKSNIVGWN